MNCKLNGVHCDALGTVGWVFTAGVTPHIQAFEMDAKEAKSLIDGGGEVDLVIDDQKILAVNKLSIIGEGPASRDKFRTVLVADLRWKWSRKLITGRYNCRRRTGQKYLASAGGPLQVGQTIDTFQFQPATLKNETAKWTPKELMEDILTKLSDGDDFDFEFDIEGNTDQLEVNDLEVRDQGHDALGIAFQHLPGTTLWVDKYGKVHIQSNIGLKEAEVISTMGPDVVDEGHASKVSYQWTRPSKIRVYFVREQEVRHNSVTLTGTDVLGTHRYMQNVCLITDPFVAINGRAVSFGSWATFDDLFPYWNLTLPAVQDDIPVPPPITHTMIQQMFFEDALTRLYVPFGSDIPQPIWMGRINSIKTHYRQTYQLNTQWVDRSYSIQAIRVALLDPTTGVRGRSQGFGDYCVKVAALPLNLKRYNGKLWTNVYGGENDSKFSLSSDLTQVTPAIVSMVDDQAGIVHFDYITDPYGAWKQIYPSTCDNIPSAVMSDKNPKGVNMIIGADGSFPKLSSTDCKATVLTHVPSVPNNNGQFYKVEVKPGDVSNLVKGLTIEPAKGPVWDVFLDVQTARFAWEDDFADVIERSFGVNVGNAAQQAAQSEKDTEQLKALLVNEDDLIALAHAKAAEIWSAMTDRYIGSKAVRLDPGVKIAGSIESVAHTVDTEGVALTKITLPEEFAHRNYLALLPPGTRKIVFREVVPH